MPVHAPPTFTLAEIGERLDQPLSGAGAARNRRYEQILEITNGPQAPGVRMEDKVGEPTTSAPSQARRQPIAGSAPMMRCQTPSATSSGTAPPRAAQTRKRPALHEQ